MVSYQVPVSHCMNKLGFIFGYYKHGYICIDFYTLSYLVVDIDDNFKMQLEDLAPLLLEPGKLVVKTINGNSVTGKDLLEYFKV